MEIRNVMIVGMGLIGGSLAMALRDAAAGAAAGGPGGGVWASGPVPVEGVPDAAGGSAEGGHAAGGSVGEGRAAAGGPGGGIRIIGGDANEATVGRCVEEGVADVAFLVDDERVDLMLSEGGIDLVVLAMPVGFATAFFRRIEKSGYAGMVTDTASTKHGICAIARSVLTDEGRYIPGHPMAGSERNGLDGASHGLFNGRYWILCPDEGTDNEMFLALHSLITSIGARCITIDRDEHDAMVAVVSHVPHMTASALVSLASRRAANREELLRLAAGGFKDSTRVAAGSAGLWTEIILSNSDAIVKELGSLIEILQDAQGMIATGDADGLRAFLGESAEVRRSIPKAWLPASEKLVLMRVSMWNRVGTIAEVTAAAGRLGCNIQSIDIGHISEDAAVLEMILTDEGDIDALEQRLKEEGFDVVTSRA